MRLNSFSVPRQLLPALALALLLGCASDGNNLPADTPFKSGKSERELRLEADALYRLSRRSLDASDFAGAIQRYNQIMLRFPFSEYATQARMELIYAKYRSFDLDGAITAANRFLKEHPRHASVDYVYYLKGLVNYQRSEALFDWLVDSSKQDQSAARWAFDDFALMIQRYPDSRFAADARLRMIDLRNRLADHDLHVVRYYVRRGAYVAATRRAERILMEYPGAPATYETLGLLEISYQRLGLQESAAEVTRLRLANGIAPVDLSGNSAQTTVANPPQLPPSESEPAV